MVIQIYLIILQLLQYPLDQLHERILHILVILSRSQKVRVPQLYNLLLPNLMTKITLVTHHNYLNILIHMLLYLAQPRLNTLKSNPSANIKSQNHPDSIFVIRPSDSSEGFLSCLNQSFVTVSQTCNLMILSLWAILFEAN